MNAPTGRPAESRVGWRARIAPLLIACLAWGGCRSVPEGSPIDLQQPGWATQQQQVVWRARSGAEELVCDVLEARHRDGRVFLQVSKTPLTLVTVRIEGGRWSVRYGPRPRSAAGPVTDPGRHLWVRVALRQSPSTELRRSDTTGGRTTWEQVSTGERIEGMSTP